MVETSRVGRAEEAVDRLRLEALACSWDHVTIGVVERVGLRSHWRCLELGAGGGSIARWLSYRCSRGSVVATDIDLRFVDGAARPNLTVMFHDAEDGPDFADGSFDLIHTRAMLAHLPGRSRIIDRAARWLAPGGWLIVEEPAIFPATSSPHQVVRHVFTAYAAVLTRWLGTDLTWARTVPGELDRAGLRDLGMAVDTMIIGDGGAGDAFWRLALAQVGPSMVRDRLLGQDDLERFSDLLEKPGFLDASFALVSAWGRRL